MRVASNHADMGVVSAADFGGVALGLSIEPHRRELRAVELLRTAGGGALSTTLGLSLWSRLDVGAVTRLRCNHSAAHLWDERVLSRFSALRVLNLSHCGLVALPGVVAALSELQELRLVGNRLKLLPPELGQLRALRVLAADSNDLAILPGGGGGCQRRVLLR